jgi:hypothetical protein
MVDKLMLARLLNSILAPDQDGLLVVIEPGDTRPEVLTTLDQETLVSVLQQMLQLLEDGSSVITNFLIAVPKGPTKH